VSITIFCFVNFTFIDLLIYQLAARREIKFSPKIGLNFKISPRSQTIIFGHAMYDGATAQRRALNFKTAKLAKSARSVLSKILYRRPHARHKILKFC